MRMCVCVHLCSNYNTFHMKHSSNNWGTNKSYTIKPYTSFSFAEGKLEQHNATTNEDPLKLAIEALSGKLQHIPCVLKTPLTVLYNHDIAPVKKDNKQELSLPLTSRKRKVFAIKKLQSNFSLSCRWREKKIESSTNADGVEFLWD